MKNNIKLVIMAVTVISSSLVHGQNQSKKALLVIDVQENLLKPNSGMHMDTSNVASLLENLNTSINAFETTNQPVIYTVNEWTNPILNILFGNVCKKGAPGTGIDSRVNMVGDKVYHKSRMSAFTNKDLAGYLKDESITELYITGLLAEACVKGTLKEALSKNYKVVIIEEAVGSKNETKKSKSLLYYKKRGAEVINAGQLANHIRQTSIKSK